MKVSTIIGARPQFIKSAPLFSAFKKEGIENLVVHTGQHYDENMSNIFFEELSIKPPDYNLGIGGGLHGEMTGKQLVAIEKIFIKEAPDLVMVLGDTNSTLAGALAATKIGIPVSHVEAGLRSFNKNMPEEVNRILTDHVSDILFAPTLKAVENLKNENIQGDHVLNVGDVMCDAARIYGEKSDIVSDIEKELGLLGVDYVVSTIHRQENTTDVNALKKILLMLNLLNCRVILPLHPRTKKICDLYNIDFSVFDNITFVEPLGFFDITKLVRGAVGVVTDSGGLQKEAYFHGKKVVVLREETEWTELVFSGYGMIFSPQKNIDSFVLEVNDFLSSPISIGEGLYGDGFAAEKIAKKLIDYI